MDAASIRTIGVAGAGSMGAGIIQQAAVHGFRVRVLEVSEAAWERGQNLIRKGLARLVKKGALCDAESEAAVGRISFSTDAASFSDADHVIEAVIEDVGAKQALYGRLEGVCKPEAIFATNTSSLSVTELAAATERPERFVGMHFFNPVPLMKLVEVVPGLATAPETVETTKALARRLDKEPVVCKDSPGFIVNRILMPMLLDAARVCEEGLASAEDIDKALKLGGGLPIGPLELIDYAGVDVLYFIGNALQEYLKEPRFAPPHLLRKMVKAGWLGRKTGKGFYEYEEKE